MAVQNNPENSTFNDQSKADIGLQQKLSPGVTVDAEEQVRATEDASLQDDSYAFDEANTDNEEYHDADGADDFDIDNDDDFVQ